MNTTLLNARTGELVSESSVVIPIEETLVDLSTGELFEPAK